MTAVAHPLQWPDGWPSAEDSAPARYKTKFFPALKHLQKELRLLGATHVVISSNVPLKPNGEPYATEGARNYEDPGVAAYFMLDGEQAAIACDRWDRVRDNMHAVGLAIAALRQLERTGASEIVRRAFVGFKQLPPSSADPRPWWKVLDIDPHGATEKSIATAYRALAMKAHPDTGGTDAAIQELNNARDAGRTALAEH